MEHYFSAKQTSDPDIKEFVLDVNKKELTFFCARGVFSYGHIDAGSLILVNVAQVQEGQRVLDLGCGIGVIGILLHFLHKNVDVVFCDVNERAISLTKMNLKRHGIDAKAIVSDGFLCIDDLFDVILLNPPFHAGRKTCLRLIDESHAHLKKGGSLQIVARHKKGGEFLSVHMKNLFNNVEVLCKKSGFRVYKSLK